LDFADKVVLITGGSSGIGLALARLLAVRGARLALMARRADKLDQAIAELRYLSKTEEVSHLALPADVTDFPQVEQAVAKMTTELGPPELVINSAGAAHPGYFEELDLQIFRWMMEVNYFGTLHVIKAVLPAMIRRGSGHIVNIASLAAILSIFGYTAYSASKYALRGFSDALRSEMKPKGIYLSIAFPPDTDTPQLAYEKQFKPFETSQLSGSASCMSAEAVAEEILRGIERRQYLIIPGWESKLLYRLSNLLGGGVYPIIDWLIARAQSKIKIKNTQHTEK
jgi:3-dehydrosphinganine reductase